MTKAEELDWIYRLRSNIYVYMPKEWLIPMNNALGAAIKALEQQPCEDTISRQAAIDALHTRFKDGFNEDKWWNSTHVLAAIEGLPSAQPELAQDLHNACTDAISRQAAIDALDVLCQEHRYKIPGKIETYSQYNEAWQDALDRAEGAIFNLPSAQPEIIRCKDCRYYQDNNDGYPHINCKWDANETPDADDFCSGAERRTDG